jgi:hypothetical protein
VKKGFKQVEIPDELHKVVKVGAAQAGIKLRDWMSAAILAYAGATKLDPVVPKTPNKEE